MALLALTRHYNYRRPGVRCRGENNPMEKKFGCVWGAEWQSFALVLRLFAKS